MLQTLFVALLIGFAVQALGDSGKAVLRGVKHFERVVFRVLSMIMWLAPIGAFGAIAAVVGETGVDALKSLGQIMVAFYLTCFLFIVVILGSLLRLVTGISIFSLLRYLAREYLLIVSTSSSEAALPGWWRRWSTWASPGRSSGSRCRPGTPSTSTAPPSI